MDPGTPKPSTAPAAGTVAEPYADRPAFTDPFLSPPLEPDEVGRLAHYRLLAELGRGGMGVVYRAEDADLRRPVAVKVMLPGSTADVRAVARFRREAEAQAKVDHVHVAPIYSVGEANGVAFLVMPLLKGMSLAAALRLTPRPPLTAAVRIGREIAEGLAAAHERGLIHRDIKPANVWLEGDKRRVKILDFGLARASGAAAGPEAPGLPLTATGAIMGTPAYMSPEQARTQPTDHRSDLFSLGVVLYQMATGALPFVGSNMFDVMAATVSHDPPPVHEVNPDVPRSLSELIWRLMAKTPSERPASADAVAKQLAAIGRALAGPTAPRGAPAADSWAGLDSTAGDEPTAAEVRSDATQVDAPDRRTVPRRSRRWAIAALVAVLSVGVVALAIDAFGGKTKPTESSTPAQPQPPQAIPPKPPESKKEPLEPDFGAERAAAEALIPFAKLRLQFEGGAKPVEVNAGGGLPPGRFAVTAIDFGRTDGKVLNAAFVTTVFLPAVTRLRALTEVRVELWQMSLSAEHLRQMTAAPLAGTLKVLTARVDLTPDALSELRKFRALAEVVFDAPEPTDALFLGVSELWQVRRLVLCRPTRRPDLTPKGWRAVAGMPLESFILFNARGAPDALRAFAAGTPPLPALEFWECRDLTDAALREHLRPTTFVRRLVFRWSDLTDASVPTLAAVKSLREIEFQATGITQKGSQALFDARPDVDITYSLKK